MGCALGSKLPEGYKLPMHPQKPMTYSNCHLIMTSNSVNSYMYDKKTRVAMVAYTPRGSDSFDKDSFRTVGLPWQPCTLAA